MNKNFKVVQINGLSGLLLLCLVLTCLFCGFVLFPIWMIMIGWNEIVATMMRCPEINYYQASLLWIFFALSSYLLFRNSMSIKIHSSNELNEDEIKDIIESEND